MRGEMAIQVCFGKIEVFFVSKICGYFVWFLIDDEAISMKCVMSLMVAFVAYLAKGVFCPGTFTDVGRQRLAMTGKAPRSA